MSGWLCALLLAAPQVDPPPATPPPWRSPTNADYGMTIALFATAGAIRLIHPDPPLGFKQSVMFDEPLRSALRATDASTRDALSITSDVLDAIAIGAPFAQIGALALSDPQNYDLAWTMAIMSLEAFGASVATVALTKSVVGRARPQAPDCTDGACRSAVNRSSFISGHTASAFTGAGLVCAYRDTLTRLSRTGLNTLACPAALVLASAVGGLRIASDRHYATDVLAGAAVGLLSGYALPRLLYAADDDGRALVGSLRLTALGGLASTAGAPSPIAGGQLTVDSRLALDDDWSLNGRLDGMLLRDADDFGFQQLVAATRFGYRGIALGAAIDFRSTQDADGRQPRWSFGPSVALGLVRGPNGAVSMSASWLPLLDGDRSLFTAQLELAPIDWLALSVTVQTFLSSVRRPAEMFTAGIGGRLPW